MTENEMKDLILSSVPAYLVSHHELWQLCGSPQHPDNGLFDEVLVSLSHNNELEVGVVFGPFDEHKRYPLRGYARSE